LVREHAQCGLTVILFKGPHPALLVHPREAPPRVGLLGLLRGSAGGAVVTKHAP
jgi:hypothetical protein